MKQNLMNYSFAAMLLVSAAAEAKTKAPLTDPAFPKARIQGNQIVVTREVAPSDEMDPESMLDPELGESPEFGEEMTAVQPTLPSLDMLDGGTLAELPGATGARGMAMGDAMAGYHPIYPSLVQWCNDSLYQLRIAKQEAMALRAMGKTVSAKKRLMRGLVDANRVGLRYPRQLGSMMGPLTRRAIARGVYLGNQIDAIARAQRENGGSQSTYWFLANYYDFVEYVWAELDTNFFLPYYYGGYRPGCARDCHGLDESLLQERLIDYVREQLNVALSTLAVVSERQGMVVPRISETGQDFMRMLQLVSLYSANDLRGIWPAEYACEIQRLYGLAYQVSSHLNGSTGIWSDRQATALFYNEADDILSSLGSCSIDWSPRGYRR